jgi:hypothetical protein
MKFKKLCILMIAGFFLFSVASYAQTTKLKEIGRYTLVKIKGEVPVAQVMKTLVDKYTGDIKYGFDTAGYGDLFFPFIEQIKAASFEEKMLPIGDKLMWMLFRSRAKVQVAKDIEWAGKEPLAVFSFTVVKGYNHYEFVMPKPCGNIALRKVEEIIPDAICDIKVTPAKANINDPISVDMSGSQNAQSMEVEVFDKAGTKVASQKLTPDSAKWQTKFDKPGEYVFKGKAYNVKEKSSTNPCEAKVYINFPPVSSLESSTKEDYVGLPVTFNASGSSDPDGEVRKVDFEITDKEGNVVAKHTATEKPFAWEKTFDKEGIFTVTAIVTDDFGAVSAPARVEVQEKYKKLFFLVDPGPMVVFAGGGSSVAFEGKLGIEYVFAPHKWSLSVSAGGAFPFSGGWDSFFMADVIANIHSGKSYFGAGAGFATSVRTGEGSTVEFVADAGYNVIDKVKTKGSIFLEGRVSGSSKVTAGFKLLL